MHRVATPCGGDCGAVEIEERGLSPLRRPAVDAADPLAHAGARGSPLSPRADRCGPRRTHRRDRAGIDSAGKKQVLGVREGHAEHRRVVKALLRDLVERGLDPERARFRGRRREGTRLGHPHGIGYDGSQPTVSAP